MKRKKPTDDWRYLDEIGKIDEMWTHIEKTFIGGVPGADKKGHSIVISYRVMPAQGDIDSTLMNYFPEGSFKNKSRFHGCVHAVGCYVLLKMMEDRAMIDMPQIDGISKMLEYVNVLGMEQRKADLQTDVKKLRDNVGESEMERKVEVLGHLERMEAFLEQVMQ